MRNSCRVSEGCISRPALWAACAPLFEVDTLLRASHAAAPAPPGCGVEGGGGGGGAAAGYILYVFISTRAVYCDSFFPQRLNHNWVLLWIIIVFHTGTGRLVRGKSPHGF